MVWAYSHVDLHYASTGIALFDVREAASLPEDCELRCWSPVYIFSLVSRCLTVLLDAVLYSVIPMLHYPPYGLINSEICLNSPHPLVLTKVLEICQRDLV